MSKSLKVRVEQEDITYAERCNCTECPVARAIRRRTGAVVYVGYRTVKAGEDYYACPKVAEEWIRRFDSGHWVDPIEFELTELPHILRKVSEC